MMTITGMIEFENAASGLRFYYRHDKSVKKEIHTYLDFECERVCCPGVGVGIVVGVCIIYAGQILK